jgi:Tfp pilus assembly major pilin PilA
MGYYDNQQVTSFTGRNAPYDVKDILLGTNAVAGGIDKFVANAAAERVSSQQDQANQYISSLLGNTNTSNYDVNMPKIRALAQFASPQMIAQLQGLTTDIKNKNDLAIAQQNSNANTSNAASTAINAQTGVDNSKINLLNVNNTNDHLIRSDANQINLTALEQQKINNAFRLGLIGNYTTRYGINSQAKTAHNSDLTQNRLITQKGNEFDSTLNLKQDIASTPKWTVDKNGNPYQVNGDNSPVPFNASTYVNKNKN